MTLPIKLAIVGLGKIARDQHLPAIAGCKHLELVAAVDRADMTDSEMALFTSIEELVASGLEVDAVSIATPPQVRHDLAQFALEQGWHVLLEKPPGATLAEVVALRESASERGLTLFTAWHSRFAAAVEPARNWLLGKQVKRAKITWREDVRVWHPGQAWIWQPGGFGVFDPGINALSIITRILPDPMFVVRSCLEIPANLSAPIAAEVHFRDRHDTPIELDLDFRQEGPQHWDIEVETDAGWLKLSEGGAVLSIESGKLEAPTNDLHGEYPALYRRFAALIRAEKSEVDVTPMRLVADAFLCGKIKIIDEFYE